MSEQSKWIIWEIKYGEIQQVDSHGVTIDVLPMPSIHHGIVSVNKIQSLVHNGSKVWLNSANNVNFEFPFANSDITFDVYDKLKIAMLASPGTKIESPGLIKLEVR